MYTTKLVYNCSTCYYTIVKVIVDTLFQNLLFFLYLQTLYHMMQLRIVLAVANT